MLADCLPPENHALQGLCMNTKRISRCVSKIGNKENSVCPCTHQIRQLFIRQPDVFKEDESNCHRIHIYKCVMSYVMYTITLLTVQSRTLTWCSSAQLDCLPRAGCSQWSSQPWWRSDLRLDQIWNPLRGLHGSKWWVCHLQQCSCSWWAWKAKINQHR